MNQKMTVRTSKVLAFFPVVLAALAIPLFAKPPAPPPPPPPAGVICFSNNDGTPTVDRINSDGSGYAAVIDLANPDLGPYADTRPQPSNRIYGTSPWWLAAVDVDGDGDTLDTEIFAFQVEPNGSLRMVQLTDCGPDYYVSNPEWSNDGLDTFFSFGVFVSSNNFHGGIYRINLGAADIDSLEADGLLPVPLADAVQVLEPPNSYVSWSPSGDRFVYQRVNSASSRTLRIRTAGGPDQVILNTSDILADWAWSPDGGRIVYRQQPRNTLVGSVRTIKPDGTGMTQLLADAKSGTQHYNFPTWSPDGLHLVLKDSGSKGANLVRLPASGGSVTIVSALGNWSGQPLRWISGTIVP